MKKVLSILLVALMLVSLLPMTALADAPASVKVKIYNGAASDFTLTLNDGDETYLVAGAENVDLIKWTETEAPTDNFVKFAYTAETGILKTTFKNLVTDQTEAGGYTCHGIWFQSGDYAVEIELIGENSLTHGKSACMKFENTGDITFTGAGSLALALNASAPGAIWCAGGGNLTIKNTAMSFNINPGSDSALHHGIFMAKGSASIEGSKINSVTLGGRLVFLGTTDKEAGGKNGAGRYTLTSDETRTIKVKDSEITSKSGKAAFSSASAMTIENSTLKMTCSGAPCFEPAPAFVGDYTAIAGLAKNAEKLDKLKEYDAKKLGSYTYVYIVPGIVDLLPTEPTTEPTEPPVATEPAETQPAETKPAETKPQETKPAETQPTEPATEPVEDEGGNNKMQFLLIGMIALVVVAAGAFAVILVLKKKKG